MTPTSGPTSGGADKRTSDHPVRAVVQISYQGSPTGDVVDFDAKFIAISAAAEMAGMHPQTLRQYDRLGLVEPARTAGGGRRYSPRDVVQLREIQRLSQDEGVNLAGIKRIMELEREVQFVQSELVAALDEARSAHNQLAELRAMTAPFHVKQRSTDIVLWQAKLWLRMFRHGRKHRCPSRKRFSSSRIAACDLDEHVGEDAPRLRTHSSQIPA